MSLCTVFDGCSAKKEEHFRKITNLFKIYFFCNTSYFLLSFDADCFLSLSFGYLSLSFGYLSLSFGYLSLSFGYLSLSFGYLSLSFGYLSLSFGYLSLTFAIFHYVSISFNMFYE